MLCAKMEVIRVKVRTNCPKTEIIENEGNFYKVNVRAAPEKGEANLEIVKFFSKLFKKEVRIVKGFKSKEKVLRVDFS